MPRYLVYGLIVESEWELPDLEPAAGAPSARIGSGEHEGTLSANPGPPRWWAEGNRVFLTDPLVGIICISGGSEVSVHLSECPDRPLLQAYLLGPALAALLHQRGFLVLHASVLARHSRALAILGNSGDGKSTLALQLCSGGWRLVADDQAVIEWTERGPAVHSGRGALRVSWEVLSHFGETSAIGTTNECRDKLLFRPGTPFSEQTPLSCLYVLGQAEQIRCTRIPPQDAFAQLVQHSFMGSLLTSSDSLALHFLQCADLAERLPVRRLERPQSLAMLARLAKVINDDFEKLVH